jgi:tetratricopeptide (TPR) repeat protein
MIKVKVICLPVLLAAMGLYEPALKDLRRSETLAAKKDDGEEAVRFALKGVSIDRNAQYLDTVAAAQARKGDFKQAVETDQAALDLLRKEKAVQATIQEYTRRLSLYKEGKPYTQHRSE